MSYLQVLTAGHQVIVEADGRRFDVRISGGHGRICRRQQLNPAASGVPPRPDVSELIELARMDLARALATEHSEIMVLEIHPFNANDDVKYCSPDCSNSSAQCGYLIALTYDGRRYDYHADQTEVTPCPPILTM